MRYKEKNVRDDGVGSLSTQDTISSQAPSKATIRDEGVWAESTVSFTALKHLLFPLIPKKDSVNLNCCWHFVCYHSAHQSGGNGRCHTSFAFAQMMFCVRTRNTICMFFIGFVPYNETKCKTTVCLCCSLKVIFWQTSLQAYFVIYFNYLTMSLSLQCLPVFFIKETKCFWETMLCCNESWHQNSFFQTLK